mmetsp:Transcript_2397/g.2513  ORF Transcript_2397/g.2513 Transcript_2397/m.2513 type:complete len:101 (+) Transcript_2397:641-943(+)
MGIFGVAAVDPISYLKYQIIALLVYTSLFAISHALISSDMKTAFETVLRILLGLSFIISGSNILLPIIIHTIYDLLITLRDHHQAMKVIKMKMLQKHIIF